MQDSSFPPEEGQEDDVSGPVLLRYVSSLSSSGAEFSIRYEKGFEDYEVSNKLQVADLQSPSSLWSFSCGLFTAGRRIHFKCRLLSEEGNVLSLIFLSLFAAITVTLLKVQSVVRIHSI